MKTRMGNVMLGAMLMILLATGISHSDLSEDLVAYWCFDDVDYPGMDCSGNGHDGIVIGAVSTTGMVGNALNFDGMDSYVNIPDAPEFDVGNFLTMSAFVKLASLDGWPSQYIIYRRQIDNYRNQLSFSVITWPETDKGKPFVEANFEVPLWGAGVYGSSLSTNEWYHLAAVYDGTSLKVFIDGEVSATQTKTSGGTDINGQSIVGSEYPLAIGRSYDGPPSAVDYYYGYYTDNFDGLIDEVRIYSRALELSEIQELAGTAEPDIDVSPSSYDFGNVEIGSSTTTYVSISNIGDGDLSIESLGFSSGSSSSFSITTAPSLPATVVPGGTVDVEITFAPTNVFYSSAVLKIGSNDPDESVVTVDLAGVGVVIEIPPSEQVQEILTFIDESVSCGILAGEGPGESADNKLNALINMIEAAGNLINDGLYEKAKQQLEDILDKCDGKSPPPDFVTGSAAADLVEMIQGLMQIIKGAVVVTVDGISKASVLWGKINVNWPYDDEDNYLGKALASTGVEAYNVELVNFPWSRDSGKTYEEVRRLRDFLREQYKIADGRKFIVVAHSWGTVLTYCALTDLTDRDKPIITCDLYVTLSLPLGIAYPPHDPPLYIMEILLSAYTIVKYGELGEDADNHWIGTPHVRRYQNYWAWGDFISGLKGGQEDNEPVDSWDKDFLDPDHRGTEDMLKWHKFTSLQSGGSIDNSWLRQAVADLIMQTLRE
jgi:pimeloyl-ACP methyl ester carboxylesterase